jgi:hypothetical protein
LIELINEIKAADSFSEDSFNKVYNIFGREHSKDCWLIKLAESGTEIGEEQLDLFYKQTGDLVELLGYDK